MHGDHIYYVANKISMEECNTILKRLYNIYRNSSVEGNFITNERCHHVTGNISTKKLYIAMYPN